MHEDDWIISNLAAVSLLGLRLSFSVNFGWNYRNWSHLKCRARLINAFAAVLHLYRPCYWHVCDCHHAIHWCCTSTVAGHKTFDAVGAKTKQLCAFSLLRSPSLVASNHNFQERNRYIHSFVLFCNDAALGPIGYFEYPGYVLLLAGAWQCLIESGGLVGWWDWWGGEVSLDSQGSTWMCLIVLRQRIFKLAKLRFLRTVQTNPETGRFCSSLLQDWLAPSRLVLAPDPLRLSGAFAAAKAAAQLATAKVEVHLHSLWI